MHAVIAHLLACGGPSQVGGTVGGSTTAYSASDPSNTSDSTTTCFAPFPWWGCEEHETAPIDTAGTPAAEADWDGDGYPGAIDCNNHDPAIHPGAPDVWYDGVDSDCGWNDDFDQDGDTWPLDGGDCDDIDPFLNPDATPICGDEVDQNCNDVDDCLLQGAYPLTDADLIIEGTESFAAGDMAEGADFNGDGQVDLSAMTLANGGHHHVWFGPFEAGEMYGSEGVDLIRQGPLDWGAWPWDVDQDGLSDVFYADTDPFGFVDDELHLWMAPFEAEITPDRMAFRFVQDGAGGYLGTFTVADLDDDGHRDLVNHQWPGGAGLDETVVGLVPGPLTGDVIASEAFSSTLTVTGGVTTFPGDQERWPPFADDYTGDGVMDLYLTSIDPELGSRGYLLSGPMVGDYGLEDTVAVGDWYGCNGGYNFGSAGDLTGDGLSDAIWAGADNVDLVDCDGWSTHPDALFVDAGPLDVPQDHVARVGFRESVPDPPSDNHWFNLTSGGDIDGDGSRDLFFSVGDTDGGVFVPSIALVWGPLAGDLDVMDQGAWFYAASDLDYPDSTAGVGDLNADGRDDILISYPSYGLGIMTPSVGRIYVFFGREGW